jgi:hypothetical protein
LDVGVPDAATGGKVAVPNPVTPTAIDPVTGLARPVPPPATLPGAATTGGATTK